MWCPTFIVNFVDGHWTRSPNVVHIDELRNHLYTVYVVTVVQQPNLRHAQNYVVHYQATIWYAQDIFVTTVMKLPTQYTEPWLKNPNIRLHIFPNGLLFHTEILIATNCLVCG